ncbi:MarR family winged helix-turn-helix transcriptional regulator [Amycolatopsis benzoatilytica]|uniref:MarR family winged helix-turn-helix transcriptional regulator n=1 Tax=Amycolatopsis benzoatilytica TaxID=346045 RepID=UPI00037BCDB6|nr:MarR family transcriptional regulator [Amycolatopsis benzoatilytica]
MAANQRELVTAATLALPQFVSAVTRFHTAVADQLGITPTQLHCLQLVHSGVSDSPAELARLLGLTTGAFTRLLDRMEDQQLVRRLPDPEDRRRLKVALTGNRMAELAELYGTLARRFAGQLGGFDRRQLAALVSFFAEGQTSAERAAEEVRQK